MPMYTKGSAKQVDKDRFDEAFTKWFCGEVNLEVAGEICGLSDRTLSKRFNIMLREGSPRENWFTEESLERQRKKG